MSAPAPLEAPQFAHRDLACGLEFAADVLPERQTVAACFRVLTGVADEPPELIGLNSITERTLSKGTRKYDGQALADAFDAIGAQWSTASGRQSTLVRVLCLPEFTLTAVELVAELLCRPVFPEEACKVAVQLAREEFKHLEDDPYELLRVESQRLTLGPIYGRNPGGEEGTLARITPAVVSEHWRRCYSAGALQVAVAGPVDVEALIERLETSFAGFGAAQRRGRAPADFTFSAATRRREKDLKQQYMAITLPGAAKDTDDYPVEEVLLGVLSGGMSGRLFTEVREKQGLVYWVGAWNEQPRGKGIVSLGASTTPERCRKTYETLVREIGRVAEDLTEEELERARNQWIAQSYTEDDLTRARANGLSDDLFHFSRPIGPGPKVEAIRAVTRERVVAYAERLAAAPRCVTTVGPAALD
jgi:predicted Zn-dependent peptidase